MSNEEAGDKQSDGGTNSAAFFRYENRQFRQINNETILQRGLAYGLKHPVRDLSGSLLERMDRGLQHKPRQRNHQEQEQEWEDCRSKSARPVAHGDPANPDANDGKCCSS